MKATLELLRTIKYFFDGWQLRLALEDVDDLEKTVVSRSIGMY